MKRLTQIFEQGIPAKDEEFGRGLSEYLLTKYFNRVKKIHGKQGIPKDMQSLIRCAFDIIKKKTEDEFLTGPMQKMAKSQ